MKDKILNLFIVMISVFLIFELLFNKNIIYASIMYALNLWVNSLIPSLFPFFIISNILINYNINNYIPKIFKNICKKMFNISDNMVVIFLLSMISGFPSNAKNAKIMYDKGKISLCEANHILLFSHFANPIFILSTVAIFFFHNERMGIIALMSHYLSNFILGILFRGTFNLNTYSNYEEKIETKSFANIFILSIRDSIDTIITICGILTVFLIISTVVVDLFNFNEYNSMIVKSIFEITIGIEALSKLDLALSFKTIIISAILSFGGLCVHMQVISQIANTNIKYIYFFIGRVYQMLISCFISYILCLLYKI